MIRSILALILLTFSGIAFSQAEKGYEIKIRIKGYTGKKMFLGNYFGDKEYLKDSAEVNKKGWFVFKREEPLPCGIYSAINAERNMRMLEFVVSSEEQQFSLETDSANSILEMKVSGSKDNMLFNSYQQYMVQKSKRRQELAKQYYDLKNRQSDSAEFIKQELDAMDDDYNGFRDKLISENPGTLTARVLLSLKDIEVPDPPMNPDGSVDSLFQYRYYKAHYWDNVDFTEDCLVRTPFFHSKLERYMTKVIVQYPDSIIAAADRLVAMSKGKKELYHYIVWWVTMNYERSQYMCMDAVPVHMWKNYYQWPEAFWVDTATMMRIRDREKVLEPLCCRKTAPNLIMRDSSLRKYVSLHGVKAKYTVLLFWDPDCSHCKKEIPIIKKMYDSLHAQYDVEIYAVGVEQELEKWKQFIIDNDLNWINVIDIYNETNFRYTYDINSTPIIYLLDEDKKIIAKKMDGKQLEDILLRELGLKDKYAPFEQEEHKNP